MKVKQIPEDFVVEEVLDLEISEGPYFYYMMKKKNWNTLDLVKTIKNKLKVRDVGFAGLKDRNAVTYQYIAVKKKIEFTIKDVEFEYLGRGKKRVYLGKLKGNKFEITLRDLDQKLKAPKEVLNLFGEQRFGGKNDKVGKLLVQKKFKEACELLDLKMDGNNFVGVLRKVGREKLRFYIRSYQSYLWNKLAKTSDEDVIYSPGFLTQGHEYDEILKEEGIDKKDFIIRAIPEISSEGSERDRLVEVEDFKILSFEDDDLNPGKKKEVISFFLKKGSYATTVLESLLNN
jgi:tRNA(Glu) U13 pseudouridine synthase TruD